MREALIKKEHLTIFFDLEKAYDTTWKYGVMKDLHELGIKDRLPQFIEGFLSNRKFRVCIDTTFSSVKNQEEGVPQDSITLFNIKINNITKELPPGIDGSLYVDDLMICCKSKYIHTIKRKLQLGLKKISR